jgi:CheY-like chemotaxis protein
MGKSLVMRQTTGMEQRGQTRVALTGFGSDEDIRRGQEAGFDFHLVKPVDFHKLRSVLDQVGA